MALDSYSPCPGGRDKKIRFCCPDMLKDLQQIETMLQNGQVSAGIAYIEQLEKDHPDCACLTAAKCVMLRQSGRWEELIELARQFHASEPKNPQAIAELSIGLAAAGDINEALSLLIDGIELNEPGKIHESMIIPALMIAARLFEENKVFPAVALAKLIQAFNPKSQDAAQLLHQIYSRKDIPLVLKEMTFDAAAPSDFPFQDRYNEAVQFLATGCWKKGKAILEELQSCVGQWPNLARSLALTQFWLGENKAACESLRTFAASDKVSDDDAIDAETIALFTQEVERTDDVFILHQVYGIADQDKTLELLLSHPTVVNIPFDPRQYANADAPAPNHIFRILDQTYPAADEAPTLKNTPILLATALFYGKQTDRDARIELQFYSPNKEKTQEQLATVLGSQLGAMESEAPLARFPWDYSHLERDFQFKPGAKLTPEMVSTLYREYLTEVFIPEWLAHPTSNLGGKTPQEIASDPSLRRRLSALVEVIALQTDSKFSEELADLLREKLALAKPAGLTIPEGDEAALIAFFQELPIWRWNRVDFSTLPGKVAGQLLSVARLFSDEKTMTRLADRVLTVPAEKEGLASRFAAYELKIERASMENRTQDALAMIEKACGEAKEFGVSDSRFNLREAMLRIAMGQPAEFQRLLSHLMMEHRDEQQTMQQLQIMLMNLGLINPDGSPRQMPTSAAAANPLQAAAETPSEPSSGLWTPDSDNGSSGGGSKLWTPE